MTEPILRVEHVSKRFGGLKAVDDVSLEVLPGQLHSIVGPNGAGKSTLFNLISGVERADSGQVTFLGRRVERLRAARIARQGMVRKFQAPSVFAGLSVAENVRVAASGRRSWWTLVAPRGRRREAERVELTLQDLELAELADRPAGSLAHGDAQRLEIAMALATEPRLLLLDEPTAGLSAAETDATARLLRRLAERCSVLVVEHDLRFIRQVSDHITVLDHGAKIADGDVETIAADERVRTAYLGSREL
jgi:branched-chain amino acid transport system ATP-binding protein